MLFRLQYLPVAVFALAVLGCSSNSDPKPATTQPTLQGRWTNEGSEQFYYSRDYVYIERDSLRSRPGAATVIADSTMSYTDTEGNVNRITPCRQQGDTLYIHWVGPASPMPYTITELTDHRLTLQSPYQPLPAPIPFANEIASYIRTELHYSR